LAAGAGSEAVRYLARGHAGRLRSLRLRWRSLLEALLLRRLHAGRAGLERLLLRSLLEALVHLTREAGELGLQLVLLLLLLLRGSKTTSLAWIARELRLHGTSTKAGWLRSETSWPRLLLLLLLEGLAILWVLTWASAVGAA
jgi:hypothetical protein